VINAKVLARKIRVWADILGKSAMTEAIISGPQLSMLKLSFALWQVEQHGTVAVPPFLAGTGK
jgi:hypothetical protein